MSNTNEQVYTIAAASYSIGICRISRAVWSYVVLDTILQCVLGNTLTPGELQHDVYYFDVC